MRVITLFVLCLFLQGDLAHAKKSSPTQEAARLERDILNGKLADRMTYGLEIALGRGAKELKARGYKLEADRMLSEWRTQHKRIYYGFATSTLRDIGEHAALSQWLDDKYTMLEMILGIDICRSLHLTAIKIFNFTPQVIFRPGSFPMDGVQGQRIDEYRRHFNEGSVYYGGVSEALYFIIWGACSAGTSGLGAVSMLCGLAGGVGERLFATFVGPKLSDWVFNKSNGVMISGGNDWDFWESNEEQ